MEPKHIHSELKHALRLSFAVYMFRVKEQQFPSVNTSQSSKQRTGPNSGAGTHRLEQRAQLWEAHSVPPIVLQSRRLSVTPTHKHKISCLLSLSTRLI